MSLETSVIQNAMDKKYTDFSAAVKIELQNKMSNHSTSTKYASDYDKIQQMKSVFAKISNSTKE
jgi:hypothetical protein